MKCQVVERLLPLFVEGDLPRRKAGRVRVHLDGCPACRALGEEFRQSQQWLRASAPPAVSGQRLELLRRSIWQRVERQPRPSPLWLAVERGLVSLRRWASQPAVAVAAVGMVVLGSVSLTRMSGIGGARLGVQTEVTAELPLDGDGVDPGDDPELVASATADELSDAVDPGETEPTEESAADNMRIEIQTKDPNVRIIWLTPPTTEAAPVEN
jgi:Putative zinc-finger